MNKKFVILLLLMVATGFVGFFGLRAVFRAVLHLEEIPVLPTLILGVDTAMAVPAAATIWFLLSSLGALKTKTKVAYYIIAAGVFFYSFTVLTQLILVVILSLFPNLPLSSEVTSMIFAIPFILSALGVYVGIRMLAGQLGIRSLWKSIIFVLVCAVVVGLASTLLPHTPDPDARAEIITKVLYGSVAWAGVVGIMATAGAIQIKNTITSTYHGAMSLLAVAVGVMTFAIFHEIIIRDTNLAATFYGLYAFSVWPFLLAGVLFMRAGQVFKDATFKKLPEKATYVDAVLYAAGLASDMRAIDSILDGLREVTAGIKPGTAPELSPEDKKKLLDVYRGIEDYLVTQEPLRKLTRPDLRARLTPEFQSELGES